MNDCSCSERYIARSISVILLGASIANFCFSEHAQSGKFYPSGAFAEMLVTYSFSCLRACAQSPTYAFPSMLRTACFTDMEIDHEIFSTVILSLPLIQEGQLSVSGERMCTILVNRLED